MQNLLLKYLNERMEPKLKKPLEPGPVITISRECGCPGTSLAQLLAEKINKIYRDQGKSQEWKWTNKEILSLASHELRLQPEKIRSLVEAGHKSYIEEFVSSFTETYYGQSEMVRKVIGDVIRKIAIDGYIVIVGRGSGAITRDIPRSLHVNIVAPLSWKAAMISEKKKLSLSEAKKHVLEVDKERNNFRDYFRGKNCDDICYDMSFNCVNLSNDQITDIILVLAKQRSII
jgi:cytidylate kinase